MSLAISPLTLATFLVTAKRHTYAAGDTAVVTALLPDARQLEYREQALLYRDIYMGSAYFVGQETVYYALADETPTAIWAMAYAGGWMPFSAHPPEVGQVYGFLRAALQQVSIARPFRGPRTWSDGAYRYTDEGHGDLDRFFGHETITYADNPVYQLHYSGGLVS